MPVSQRLVAGVDSSTQSCKVVVCDADTGEILRSARAPHPDGTEVHPDRWWEAWLEATGGGILDGVSAVAVAGQQHGMVTLDEFDEVVRPALLWNDTRSAPDAEALLGELGGAAAWAAQVGVVPVAAVTVTKLRWLARCEPETAARVRRCVLPHDWLTGRILGGGLAPREWTTDRGDASGTGYWSAVTGDYRPDILEFAMGRTIAVPRVLGPDEAAGMTADGMLVTRDGNPDLIARDRANGDLWLYPGTGDGGLPYRVRIGTGWNSMRNIVSIGDFNHDGTYDLLAVESATGKLFLYPGVGTSFPVRVQVGSGWTTNYTPLL